MKIQNKKKYLLFGLGLIIIAVIYSSIFRAFFEQDEWNLFGIYFQLANKNLFTVIISFLSPSGGHYVPLTSIVSYVLFLLFKLNYFGYAFFSILMHIFIVVSAFFLFRKIFKKDVVAILGAIFFGLLPSIHQGTSWVIADINTQGATLFGILSLLLFLEYINKKGNKYFVLSIFTLFVSLLFKETALAFFALLPLTYLIYKSPKEFIKNKKNIIIIFILGVLYLVFRFVSIKYFSSSVGSFIGSSYPSFKDLIYNFFTFPIKSINQTLIYPNTVINLSLFITRFLPSNLTGSIGSPSFVAFSEKWVFEALNFIIFGVIFFLAIFKFKKIYKSQIGKNLLFGFLFATSNSFVYAFSPERSGIVAVIDSRNLYFLAIGSIIFFISLLQIYFKEKMIIAFIFVFTILNVFLLTSELRVLVKEGETRSFILEAIKSSYPSLPRQVVFYTESDSSFYGLPETTRILPFQSGFGQTLLVWYESSEKFPFGFFKNNFLWNIDSEGYKDINGRGFGYYWNFNDLASSVKENNLALEDVLSFRYDSLGSTGDIQNISDEVRGRLVGYFSKKREIKILPTFLSSRQNASDLVKIVDGDRKTFWDSKLPYSNPQFIVVDLKSTRKIAEIDIDKYDNLDQNKVGYMISVSKDGKNWTPVYEKERVDYDKEGVAKLYFQPTSSQFVKINQIGKHDFADWVISELKIYEAY